MIFKNGGGHSLTFRYVRLTARHENELGVERPCCTRLGAQGLSRVKEA